jgi:hypothetical protein
MDASTATLTVEQAYRVMLHFLEKEYTLSESSDLADLLSGYRMDNDGHTGDPAVWDEWLEAVGKVKALRPG